MQAAHVKSALAPLFGAGVAVAVLDIDTPVITNDFPEEDVAISRAVPSRKAEFRAGRHAARLALAQVGAPQVAIPMARDRAPIWPVGFTGCISHAAGLAVAVASPTQAHRALGVDIEPDTPLEPDLWGDILIRSERNWLKTQPEAQHEHLAKQLFSIKECAYKAQFTLSETLLDFSAFAVTLDRESDLFQAVFQSNIPPFSKGDSISGHSLVTHGLILSTTHI